jgi:hypothetical protein
MTEKTPLSLPTPAELAATEAELRPLFEQSASAPTQAALLRLLEHAEGLPTPSVKRAPIRSFIALAAIALLAIGVGRWTLPTEAPEVAAASSLDQGHDAVAIDDLAWHDDDLADGLDLLGLPLGSDDPQRAIELVDTLIAELDDV